MCHCADGGAAVARSLVSLQESVQRQAEDKQSLGNEPETIAMRGCKGVRTMEHALTSEAYHDRMYMPSGNSSFALWYNFEKCDVVQKKTCFVATL